MDIERQAHNRTNKGNRIYEADKHLMAERKDKWLSEADRKD